MSKGLLCSTPCGAVWDLGCPEGSNGVDFLFNRYSRLVLGIAYRILGDSNEAEDVVQEVFLYLHQKPQLFDPSRGSVKAWIIQIALSRALDRKVYLARRGFYGAANVDSLHLPQETDLEQQIAAKLNRKHLERAFSDLTEMQRRTIEFFYFEGLELREISKQLRKPLGTVRHHLYRGLSRLRKSSLVHRLL
ncbi:MAG: sigma-70 family RNA polymerase sigma factor [Acidobacteriaceae bacterium]|nr:sigma-70 family RNA polymerase sigma factor [Acidobacteriaceae bacterium]